MINLAPVDWSGRRLTPAGAAGQVRPRRSESDEEAQRPPRGKQAPGAEINLLVQQGIRKREKQIWGFKKENEGRNRWKEVYQWSLFA